VAQRRVVGYRLPFFAALRGGLREAGLELALVHGSARPSEASRGDSATLPWARSVPTRYLPWADGPAVWLALPEEEVAAADLVVLPGDPGFLPLYPLFARRALRGRPRVALWGHGANFQRPREAGARRLLRRWVNRRPDWWLAYSRLSVDRVAADGFPRARITRVDNAVDTGALARWRDEVTAEELEALRGALGLGEGPRAVFLGSLHEHRRLPVLFAAADELRARLPGFGLVIAGDGPLAAEVRAFVRARPWACWVGALHGREKVRHALLGRLLLNPGMVGLNLLDAFALGLPVVTTDCGIHSPEIAYLEEGRTGVVSAPDAASFAGAAARLLADGERLDAMAQRCREAAGRYTVEAMARRFAGGVLAALGAAA